MKNNICLSLNLKFFGVDCRCILVSLTCISPTPLQVSTIHVSKVPFALSAVLELPECFSAHINCWNRFRRFSFRREILSRLTLNPSFRMQVSSSSSAAPFSFLLLSLSPSSEIAFAWGRRRYADVCCVIHTYVNAIWLCFIYQRNALVLYIYRFILIFLVTCTKWLFHTIE